MGIQPTASKTDLLLQCARPFSEGVEIEAREPGEAALYGTAIHKELESLALGASLDSVSEHARQAWGALQRFLEGENPWGETFKIVRAEIHQAWKPGGAVRNGVAFDEGAHTYHLRPGEIGGTPDLVLLSDKGHFVVLDYKTGAGIAGDWANNPRTGQLLTLFGMSIGGRNRGGDGGVAILHTPKGGIPVVYCKPVTEMELKRHTARLKVAMSRVDDGSLRPGPECKYCPARVGCPAKDGELLKSAGALVRKVVGSEGLRDRVDPGAFHALLTELDKLIATARARFKEEVREGTVIERPDGKVLQIVTREVERVSKKKVLEVLGKKEGERELSRWRDIGVLTKEIEERLEAK